MHPSRLPAHRPLAAPLVVLGLLCAGLPWPTAIAAELVVAVGGVADAQGSVGCALFSLEGADRFPLNQEAAIRQRSPARPGATQCVFGNLPAGRYAVSAAHDLNDNGRTDRNFVGLPTEPWAVSNNVRPALRAPRFAEAAFTLEATDSRRIELRLQR